MTTFDGFDPMNANDLRDITISLITTSLTDDMEAMTAILDSLKDQGDACAVIVTLVGYVHQNMQFIAQQTGHDLLEVWRAATLAAPDVSDA
jgi:division protein CdvB (Snf7/Vps24/ESCRT-III family)